MTAYCLGFAFLQNWNEPQKVVLIRKTKPDWQKGKLNGVGGKIEDDEYCNVAMAREFQEETGCKTFSSDWTFFTEMHFDKDVIVYCFATKLFSHQTVQTTTDEEIITVPFQDLPGDVLPNLYWLVPMAKWAAENPSRVILAVPRVLRHA